MQTLNTVIESCMRGTPNLDAVLTLFDNSGVILFIAVLIELTIPLPSAVKIIKLSSVLKMMAAKVNLESNSPSQKVFAGIMLPVVVFIVGGVVAVILHALAGFDNLLALFLLPLLLSSRIPLDTAWQIHYLLRHNDKIHARNLLAQRVERDCSRLSYLGISKATCEYVIMAMICNWLAVIIWFLIADLEGAVIMQLCSLMSQAFSAKNRPQNMGFGAAISRVHQFMLLPVAFILLLLSLISLHPSHALRGAVLGLSVHPAPVSGFIQGLIGGALKIALGGPRAYGDKIITLKRYGGDEQPDSSSAQTVSKHIRAKGLLFCLLCALIAVFTA